MLFSEAWLREWVDPAISTEQLVAQLTMAGLEVDGWQAAAKPFTNVVVAEVLAVEPHPDADKLRVCQVSDGSEQFQVVCGAPNVHAGLKVPFARIGARLDDDFKIKKAKLRGIESQGMLCSADELGLAENADGLLELSPDAPVGNDIREYLNLNDALIDIDLTPNRGDCLSIAGLAREAGVLNKMSVRAPQIDAVPASLSDGIDIQLQSPEDCPRYLGRIIRNINPEAQSPVWLVEKLRRSDIRSIDPVVDVTNYVLMELGHPMHAFDLDKIQGGIVVRRAVENEPLTLLDGKEVKLNQDTLVIADRSKALAIAGVMGGQESAVNGSSRHILLESAFFNPLSIAGKARAYGLQTDAAHRYERGVDYQLAEKAMERATGLLLAIVGGEAGPVIEACGALPEAKPIRLRRQRIAHMLGMALPDEEVVSILTGLGLQLLAQDEQSWTFLTPSWRFDLSIEVDLIEELARIHGYDNLPVTSGGASLGLKSSPEGKTGVRQYRRLLTGLGYQEIISYSFVEPGLEAQLQGEGQGIRLANPISQDMSVMRGSLWSGLLLTLKHNQNRQLNRLRLFEGGLVFRREGDELRQIPSLGGLLWGSVLPEQWAEKTRDVDFFDAKGDLEKLLSLGQPLSEYHFAQAEHRALQPGQTARVLRQGKPCGWLGALHPVLQKKLDIPGKVYLFELELTQIADARLPKARELSRYPSVRRDLAMVVEEAIEIADILGEIRQNAGQSLIETSVFDLYQGENIPKGKKSLALGLTFQHPSRTLNDEEINSIIDNCIKALEDKFNIELRK